MPTETAMTNFAQPFNPAPFGPLPEQPHWIVDLALPAEDRSIESICLEPDGNRLFVMSSDRGYTVEAFDLARRERLWQQGELPAAGGSMLACGEQLILCGYVLDAGSGRIVDRFHEPIDASGLERTFLAGKLGSRVIFGLMDGEGEHKLAVFDLASRTLRIHSDDLDYPEVYFGDSELIGMQASTVLRYDFVADRTIWRYSDAGAVSCVCDGRHVFVIGGDGRLAKLDAASGQVLAEVQLDQAYTSTRGSWIYLSDDLLYVYKNAGYPNGFAALRCSDLSLVWQRQWGIHDDDWTLPLHLAGDLLLLMNGNYHQRDEVIVLDRHSGAPLAVRKLAFTGEVLQANRFASNADWLVAHNNGGGQVICYRNTTPYRSPAAGTP